MILYPAIDLLDGGVVRLLKGDFNAVTVYGDNPGAVAETFKTAGSDWIHVVDLAGARDGKRGQSAAIEAIAGTGIKVQAGGGVRDTADIEALLEMGVSRVVIGSLAITEPETVLPWLDRFGAERVTLALDVQYINGDYRPAVRGWTDVLTVTIDDVIAAYSGCELQHALVTDIARDGDLSGPNGQLYTRLMRAYPGIQWQASGGISSLQDIEALRESGCAGAVTGRAIYEGKFTLEEALACSRGA